MEPESIAIAALEHAAYCERQWGLIHLDRFWLDNDDTMRGHHTHERVDQATGARRGPVQTEWRLPVWSEQMGLHGYCDAVEFEDGGAITPVEYKSGKRFERPAEIQLCAQAMCLEEMFDTHILIGQIYLAGTHRLTPVNLDDTLRAEVRAVVDTVRRLERGRTLPSPRDDQRCSRCSFDEHCLPSIVASRRRVAALNASTWRV